MRLPRVLSVVYPTTLEPSVGVLKRFLLTGLFLVGLCLRCPAVSAQKNSEWELLLRRPALSGHEKPLLDEIAKKLDKLSPRFDDAGNLFFLLGSGAPHRLIVTPIDEPGYLVREITQEGFLRVESVPAQPSSQGLNSLDSPQLVTVVTREGREIPGVLTQVFSTELTFQNSASEISRSAKLYVDLGAKNVDEVQKAGVELSDAVVAAREWIKVGKGGEAGPAVGDRFGAYALVTVLQEWERSKANGTTAIALVAQNWIGAGGLAPLLKETRPEELIFIGRNISFVDSFDDTTRSRPGSGVMIGGSTSPAGTNQPLVSEFQAVARKQRIQFHSVFSDKPELLARVPDAFIPKRWATLTVPILWPGTSSEYIAMQDVSQLRMLLEAYLEIPVTRDTSEESLPSATSTRAPEDLIGAYGIGGHEDEVAEVVQNRLAQPLRKMLQRDATGDLVLPIGGGTKKERMPQIVFVAHMDEVGYVVAGIGQDGRLQLEGAGHSYPSYPSGRLMLVHKKEGPPVGGILELPANIPKRELPSVKNVRTYLFVGTHSRLETEKLGISAGDFVTVPKTYTPLIGTRATAPSFDDRMGCAALIQAANDIGPELPGRDVTFVWSRRGGEGARATRAFVQDTVARPSPDLVFAVDAIASLDPPGKRLDGGALGKGFVVPPPDRLKTVPQYYIDHIVELASEEGLSLQHAAVSNDDVEPMLSSPDSIDIPLGWPVRYWNSAAELADMRDFQALTKIIETIARKW